MHVKGTNLKVIKEAILEKYGRDGWERYLHLLSEETRKIMDGLILASSLYPKETYKEANMVADFLFGDGNGSFIRELGKRSSTVSVFQLYKELIGKKIETPQDVIKYVPAAVMPKIFNGGIGETIRITEHSGTFRVGAEFVDDRELLWVIAQRGIGWAQELLKHAGAENPRLAHLRWGTWKNGIPYAEIEMEWD